MEIYTPDTRSPLPIPNSDVRQEPFLGGIVEHVTRHREICRTNKKSHVVTNCTAPKDTVIFTVEKKLDSSFNAIVPEKQKIDTLVVELGWFGRHFEGLHKIFFAVRTCVITLLDKVIANLTR